MTEHYDTSKDPEEEIIYVSKSEIKRDMLLLKKIGARLMDLKPAQLEQLILTEQLRYAIVESRRITSKNARKRHLGFIGKLMQHQDLEHIQEYIDHLDQKSDLYKKQFHKLEVWRDKLLSNNSEELTNYLKEYPNSDRQKLRQMVRNSLKEKELGKPPTNARKLFKYLRDLAEL